MTAHTNHYVEITQTQTHVMVLTNMFLVFYAEDAISIAIDSIKLSVASDAKNLWHWHSHRRIGHHLLVVVREKHVQVVLVECVDDATNRVFFDALHDTLWAIDKRLCFGHSAWQSIGVQLTEFELRIGMTCEAYLRRVLHALQLSPPHSLQDWHGEPPVPLRLDRVVVRDASITPLSYQPTSQHNVHFYVTIIMQILQELEASADSLIHSLIHTIRQRLLSPIYVHHDFAELILYSHQSLLQSHRSLQVRQADIVQTADIALLYERWVWIAVLRAVGCGDMQIRRLIDGDRVYVGENGLMCAYQRRLSPRYARTGWSRDGRVAVPDVMLWIESNVDEYRALIVDAKCSIGLHTPDPSALNDVTAYLRRIGVGDGDPDAAILVHPGNNLDRWPSGLIVVGTNGVHADALESIIHAWLAHEI